MGELWLVAGDHDERRLLYAELLEAGYDVLPLPDASAMTSFLSGGLPKPQLVLLAVSSDGHPSSEAIAQLAERISGAPLMLVVPAAWPRDAERLAGRVAVTLLRPVSIGQVVEVVRAIWPPEQAP